MVHVDSEVWPGVRKVWEVQERGYVNDQRVADSRVGGGPQDCPAISHRPEHSTGWLSGLSGGGRSWIEALAGINLEIWVEIGLTRKQHRGKFP